MATTKIEWATKVWNPVTGCTKVSPGCANCYAERFTKRLQANPKTMEKYSEGFKVQCHDIELFKPMDWKNGERVFLCSMGDLFHEDVPFEFIYRVMQVIYRKPGIIFMILTKRAQRMHEFFKWFTKWNTENLVKEFPNMWLGVSAENQEQAENRIPFLLQIPAKIHFLSCEPLLGSIDLEHWENTGCPSEFINELNWVITGGETGPKARPMHPDWVRSIRDQCKAANVPFFFKGWGEWIDNQNSNGCDISLGKFLVSKKHTFGTGYASTDVNRIGKKYTGNLLDGIEYNEFPTIKP